MIPVVNSKVIKGVRSQHDYVVSHSSDTLFVWNIRKQLQGKRVTKQLEEWIEEKKEMKCFGEITSFTFDYQRLYVTLGPYKESKGRLIVLGLNDLQV